MSTTEALLDAARERIGGERITIHAAAGGIAADGIQVRWRRLYPDGALSDERCMSACGLGEALLQIVRYEDAADESDAARTVCLADVLEFLREQSSSDEDGYESYLLPSDLASAIAHEFGAHND